MEHFGYHFLEISTEHSEMFLQTFLECSTFLKKQIFIQNIFGIRSEHCDLFWNIFEMFFQNTLKYFQTILKCQTFFGTFWVNIS